MRARMIAARRDGQRHAPESPHLDVDIARALGDGGDSRPGQLRRQRDRARALPCEIGSGRLVVDVDQRPDVKRPAPNHRDQRHVVHLHRAPACRQLAVAADLALQRRQGQRAQHHRLAGPLQPLDYVCHAVLEERQALGAHDLSDRDAIDRRLVGNPGIEVPEPIGGPVEEPRPQRQSCGHMARAPLAIARS